MANVKFIRASFDELVQTVCDVNVLNQALLDVAGDQPSNLLSTYSASVFRIQKSMDDFEVVMRQRVLPILEDFSAVTD